MLTLIITLTSTSFQILRYIQLQILTIRGSQQQRRSLTLHEFLSRRSQITLVEFDAVVDYYFKTGQFPDTALQRVDSRASSYPSVQNHG